MRIGTFNTNNEQRKTNNEERITNYEQRLRILNEQNKDSLGG